MSTHTVNTVHRRLDRTRLILERKLREPVLTYLSRLASIAIAAWSNRLRKAKKFKDPVDWEYIENLGIGYVKPIILEAYTQGTKGAYGVVGLKGVFDVYNTESVEVVNEICSKLISNITDETRKAINRVLSADIEEGIGRVGVVRDLRSFVGLTDLQAKRVEDFKAWLAREYPDASVKEIARRTGQLRNELLNQRLSTIARTETARAQNYGFVTALSSIGVDQFEFSAYPGCCDACEALDGKIIDMDEADEIVPVHPNCRCQLLPYINQNVIDEPLKSPPEGVEENNV